MLLPRPGTVLASIGRRAPSSGRRRGRDHRMDDGRQRHGQSVRNANPPRLIALRLPATDARRATWVHGARRGWPLTSFCVGF
jgi:hypothetical protein